jgi:hypothetical protein
MGWMFVIAVIVALAGLVLSTLWSPLEIAGPAKGQHNMH